MLKLHIFRITLPNFTLLICKNSLQLFYFSIFLAVRFAHFPPTCLLSIGNQFHIFQRKPTAHKKEGDGVAFVAKLIFRSGHGSQARTAHSNFAHRS